MLIIVLKGCKPFTELEECFIAHTPSATSCKISPALPGWAGHARNEREKEKSREEGRTKEGVRERQRN